MSPRATRLLLIRHGEVESGWQQRIYGSLDVPLSDRGRQDGSRVAEVLGGTRLEAVISSGLTRTEHMAARLREHRGLPRIDDPGLRELDRGEWAGMTRQELEARWPDAWNDWISSAATARPPGGESLIDLFSRVRRRIDHWSRAHPGRSIALITHGWVVRVLVCHVLDLPLVDAPRLDVRTGDITVIRWPSSVNSFPPELEGLALDAPPAQLSE